MAAIVPVLPDLVAGNRARDAAGVLRDIETLMAGITPDWTDRSQSDPGVALAQLFAYLFDHVLYQVTRGLSDSTFANTQRRSAAVALAETLGYRVDGASAASTLVQFTLNAVQGVDVVVPLGTQVQGLHQGNVVVFETDVAAVIPAGALTATVAASHGKEAQQVLGTSLGTAHQQFVIISPSVVKNKTQNSLVVLVGADPWTEVQSFAQSVANSRHFTVRRDYRDLLTVIFGDGFTGSIPGAGLAIAARYRDGGGTVGNVPPGVLTTLNEALAVAATVTNTTAAQGGAPRQSLASIRMAAPGYFSTQQRVVTSADYDVTAASVSGVLRAQAVRTALNHVRVRCVPMSWDGSALNVVVADAVQLALDQKRMITDVVSVTTAIQVRPRIVMVVTVARGMSRALVAAAVRSSAAALYAQNTLGFGVDSENRGLFVSDLIAAVDNTTGVGHVDVRTFTRVPLLLGLGTGGWDVAAAPAVLGSVSVGANARNETWVITFLSPTTFSVAGSLVGTQVAQGVMGQVYTSDGGEVAFTITAAATPMAAGNYGRFRTSSPLGNIPVVQEEHPVYRGADLDLTMIGGVP